MQKISGIGPLRSARLALRPLIAADTEAFRAMTDEAAITTVVHFLPTPFTLADAGALIAGAGDGRDCFWGVWRVDDGVLVGAVGTHLHGEDEIEIGYWFASAARGQGFAYEAAQTLIAALLRAFPARRVVAECRPENQASWNLLEKLGLRADGRDGARAGRKRLVLTS